MTLSLEYEYEGVRYILKWDVDTLYLTTVDDDGHRFTDKYHGSLARDIFRFHAERMLAEAEA